MNKFKYISLFFGLIVFVFNIKMACALNLEQEALDINSRFIDILNEIKRKNFILNGNDIVNEFLTPTDMHCSGKNSNDFTCNYHMKFNTIGEKKEERPNCNIFLKVGLPNNYIEEQIEQIKKDNNVLREFNINSNNPVDFVISSGYNIYMITGNKLYYGEIRRNLNPVDHGYRIASDDFMSNYREKKDDTEDKIIFGGEVTSKKW